MHLVGLSFFLLPHVEYIKGIQKKHGECDEPEVLNVPPTVETCAVWPQRAIAEKYAVWPRKFFSQTNSGFGDPQQFTV